MSDTLTTPSSDAADIAYWNDLTNKVRYGADGLIPGVTSAPVSNPGMASVAPNIGANLGAVAANVGPSMGSALGPAMPSIGATMPAAAPAPAAPTPAPAAPTPDYNAQVPTGTPGTLSSMASGVAALPGEIHSGLAKAFPNWVSPPTSSAPPQAAPAAPPAPSGAALAAAQAASARPPAAPVGAPVAAPVAPVVPATIPTGEKPGGRDYSDLVAPIFGAESGNNPNAKNPNSTASGPGQFTDGTFQSFVASPANVGSPANNGKPWTMADKNTDAAQSQATTWLAAQNDGVFQRVLGRPATNLELMAAHMLGGSAAAQMAANPNGSALKTLGAAPIAANAGVLNPNMTNGQALASAENFYAKGARNAPPGATVATTAQGPLGLSGQPVDTGQSSPFGSNFEPQPLPYTAGQMAQPKGSALLALASGLLSGPNFGQGLGKGLAAMNAVNQQGIGNKMAINNATLENNRAGQQMQYMQNMMANRNIRTDATVAPKAFGQPIQGTDAQGKPIMLQPMRDGQGNVTNVPLPGVTSSMMNANNRYDPTVQGQISTAKMAGNEGAKDTANDIDELNEKGQASVARAQQLTALQAQLPTAGTGPGLAAIKRDIANYFNVPIGNTDPTSAQLSTSIMSQLRGGGFMGKNMRTQREFTTIMEGLAGADKNPQALAGVITGLKNINDFQGQAYNDWNNLPSNTKVTMRQNPDQYQSWLRDETNAWGAKLDKSGGIYGTKNASAPTSAATPSVPQPGTTLHYDTQGNLVQ